MAETRAPPDGASPALRAVLDRSEGAGGKASLLRDEIVASWERCARAGLRPVRLASGTTLRADRATFGQVFCTRRAAPTQQADSDD